jgi:hypothetical protein
MNSSDAGERSQWCAQLFEVGQDSAYTSLRTTPWFTRKKNRRLYRYYLPVRENKEHAGASGLPRFPAAELEAAGARVAVCAKPSPCQMETALRSAPGTQNRHRSNSRSLGDIAGWRCWNQVRRGP